jgi:hypothetical protein
MSDRKNISKFAVKRINEHNTIDKKNTVCIICGFENTTFYDNEHRYCNICCKQYNIIIKENKSCVPNCSVS